ncbi:hypothetical protein ACIBF5_13755 [Micromonospora sp. NPDC050417]
MTTAAGNHCPAAVRLCASYSGGVAAHRASRPSRRPGADERMG